MFQFSNWKHLIWWQKTKIAAATTIGATLILVIIFTIFISAFAQSDLLQKLSWIAFSACPLLIVVMISSFARVQERINLRTNSSLSHKPNENQSRIK